MCNVMRIAQNEKERNTPVRTPENSEKEAENKPKTYWSEINL